MGLFGKRRSSDDADAAKKNSAADEAQDTPVEIEEVDVVEETTIPTTRSKRSGMFALTEKPSYKRISKILDEIKLNYQILPDESGILVPFDNGYIQIVLQDEVLLHLNGIWGRPFPIHVVPQFKSFATQINAEWLLPRCFITTDDQGMSFLSGDVVIPYPKGCTNEQLQEGVAAGIGTITNAFNEATKQFGEVDFGTDPITEQSEK